MTEPTLRKQLIIVEGPDGSGKTTLCNKLAEKYDARIIHFGPELKYCGKQLANMYIDGMLDAIHGSHAIILDRCWVSEPIYGYVYRGNESRLDRTTMRMLDRLALTCNAVMVWCRTDWLTTQENWIKDKDKSLFFEEKLEQQRQVWATYGEQPSAHTDIPALIYDYQHSSDEELFRALGHYTDVPRLHPVPTARGGLGGGGSLTSDGSRYGKTVLMVGESYGPIKNMDHWLQWPFASWSDAGCSRWLTAQLEQYHFPENRFTWINADCPHLDWYLRNVEQYRAVVALGGDAFKAVQQRVPMPQQFRVLRAEHPQYVRRFRRYQQYSLINTLKRIFE